MDQKSNNLLFTFLFLFLLLDSYSIGLSDFSYFYDTLFVICFTCPFLGSVD